jgi:hypothetical protein
MGHQVSILPHVGHLAIQFPESNGVFAHVIDLRSILNRHSEQELRFASMKAASIIGVALLCVACVWFFFRNPNRPPRQKGSSPESFFMRPKR